MHYAHWIICWPRRMRSSSLRGSHCERTKLNRRSWSAKMEAALLHRKRHDWLWSSTIWTRWRKLLIVWRLSNQECKRLELLAGNLWPRSWKRTEKKSLMITWLSWRILLISLEAWGIDWQSWKRKLMTYSRITWRQIIEEAPLSFAANFYPLDQSGFQSKAGFICHVCSITV